MHSAAT